MHSQSSNLTNDLRVGLLGIVGASALSGSGNFSSATPEWKDVISVRWSTLTYFVLIFSFVII